LSDLQQLRRIINSKLNNVSDTVKLGNGDLASLVETVGDLDRVDTTVKEGGGGFEESTSENCEESSGEWAVDEQSRPSGNALRRAEGRKDRGRET
jgi:hypothetical protein